MAAPLLRVLGGSCSAVTASTGTPSPLEERAWLPSGASQALGFVPRINGACVVGGEVCPAPLWWLWAQCRGVTKRRNSWACIGNPNPEQETIKGTHAQETPAYQRSAVVDCLVHGLVMLLVALLFITKRRDG